MILSRHQSGRSSALQAIRLQDNDKHYGVEVAKLGIGAKASRGQTYPSVIKG
jgi:hypothetical protein